MPEEKPKEESQAIEFYEGMEMPEQFKSAEMTRGTQTLILGILIVIAGGVIAYGAQKPRDMPAAVVAQIPASITVPESVEEPTAEDILAVTPRRGYSDPEIEAGYQRALKLNREICRTTGQNCNL